MRESIKSMSFTPTYLCISIKLPKVVTPTVRAITSMPSNFDHLDACKLSIVRRCEETIDVLEAGICERQEWLCLADKTLEPPVFIMKFTSRTLSSLRKNNTSSLNIQKKIDTILSKKNITIEGKIMIDNAKKCSDMKTSVEIDEFLATLESDLEVRFKDVTPEFMESIERDKEREISVIRTRNLKELQAHISHIYNTEQCPTTFILNNKKGDIKSPIDTTSRTVERALIDLKASQAKDRVLYLQLIEDIKERDKKSMIDFEASMSQKHDIEHIRKSYIAELDKHKKRDIKRFGAECTMRSRYFRADMVVNIDENVINDMVNVYSIKVQNCKVLKPSSLLLSTALLHIDMSYSSCTICNSEVTDWDTFTNILRDYWCYLGCSPSLQTEYVQMVIMYAKLSANNSLKYKSIARDAEIDQLWKKIDALYEIVEHLDKSILNECKLITKAINDKASSASKLSQMTQKRHANVIKYEEAIRLGAEHECQREQSKEKTTRRKPI